VPWVALARLDELPEGGLVARAHDGQQVLLARLRGAVYALDDVCTHGGAPLHEGDLERAGPCLVTCPWHEAHFDLRTGRVHQDSPWATDTRAYRVELRDGVVWVEL
jgi:nitrite reductase/ring-hydroxylating ferredoxin subunit